MELKDFIAETLSQIIDGVRIAQSREHGDNINASMIGTHYGGHLVNSGAKGVATRVDFDVSVSAETKGGAGGKLTVFGIGAEAGANHTAASANRISFSVPVRLPDGDPEREKALEQERQNARAKAAAARPAKSDWLAR